MIIFDIYIYIYTYISYLYISYVYTSYIYMCVCRSQPLSVPNALKHCGFPRGFRACKLQRSPLKNPTKIMCRAKRWLAIVVGAHAKRSAGPKTGVIFHGTPFLLGKCYGVLYGKGIPCHWGSLKILQIQLLVWGDQTIEIYGSFAGFPLEYCFFWGWYYNDAWFCGWWTLAPFNCHIK